MSGIINQVGARSGTISVGDYPVSTGTVTLSGTTGLDYEEGSWTPTGDVDFDQATGYYTKIGRLVTLSFAILWGSDTDGSGAQIKSLPFTAAGTNSRGGGFLSYNSDGTASSLYMGSTTTVYVQASAGAGVVTNTDLQTRDLMGVITYITS